MSIRYLKNKDIDKVRWDQTIEQASNGRVYAYSWYLDGIAEHWDALILDDYEVIMPLPWNSKYGIHYLYTPFFIQQLGLYSKDPVNPELYTRFFQSIPSKFRVVDLSVNTDQPIPLKNLILMKRRTNYILNIDRPYEEIWNDYNRRVRRVLREPIGCDFIETDDFNVIIEDYKSLIGEKFDKVQQKHYERLSTVAGIAKSKGMLLACRIMDQNGVALASHILFRSHGRAYLLAGSQTPEGREKNANLFFMDAFFKTYCGSVKIFDFEGSDIPAIASFFKSWGSEPEFYSRVRLSRFPFNLLKK